RAGVEYLLPLKGVVVPLRAGVFHGKSPVPDLGAAGAHPVHGFSAGSGLNFNRVVFDVAWEHRSSTNGIGAALSADFSTSLGVFATERATEDRLVASLVVR